MISDVLSTALSEIRKYQSTLPDVYADYAPEIENVKRGMEALMQRLDDPHGEPEPENLLSSYPLLEALCEGLRETEGPMPADMESRHSRHADVLETILLALRDEHFDGHECAAERCEVCGKPHYEETECDAEPGCGYGVAPPDEEIHEEPDGKIGFPESDDTFPPCTAHGADTPPGPRRLDAKKPSAFRRPVKP